VREPEARAEPEPVPAPPVDTSPPPAEVAAPPAIETEPPPPRDDPAKADPEPPKTPAPKPATRGRQTSVFVRVDGAIDAGATPKIGGDVGGAVGVLHRRLRIEATGLYLLPSPLTFQDQRVGVVARWALGVRACGRFVRTVLEIPLCLGLEGGRFLASGAGITVSPLDARPPWFAILLGLGLVWSPHPRVGLGVRTEFVVAPLRAPFTVSDQLVHITQPVGVRFGGGLEIRFGPGARRDGTSPARPRNK